MHISPHFAKNSLTSNRHFFNIFTNISFFVFSSNFLFLFIIILYSEGVKVLLRKKCLFIFVVLHIKKCRTDQDRPSKMQKFLHLEPPVLCCFCFFFSVKKSFGGKSYRSWGLKVPPLLKKRGGGKLWYQIRTFAS